MRPGEAVLLHGTLPPIHLDAVRWWNERRLRDIVNGHGEVQFTAPGDLGTCPLTSDQVSEGSGALDERTFAAALSGLPAIRTVKKATERLADGHRARPVGRCEECRTELHEGEAQVRRRASGTVIRCAPSCRDRAALRDLE
jgi:type IV secretion system protein VirD4